MYNLQAIFNEIINTATQYEEFTIKELWEWTIFDDKNINLNDSLEFHKYSRDPIKERRQELSSTQEIYGDFLLFDYIPHVPLLKIINLDSLQSMKNEILSERGILNGFSGMQIPIVKGKAIDINSILEYKTESFNEFIDQFKNDLLKFSEIDSRKSLIDIQNEGLNLILRYKEKLNTKEIYFVLYTIYIVNCKIGDPRVADLINDLMTFVV